MTVMRPQNCIHAENTGVLRRAAGRMYFKPTLIAPDKVYEYGIDLWATSHVFKARHRLRLEVSSSNFPRYDRNQNTGSDLFVDRELKTARQTVHHSGPYASHIVLPVIPR